VRHRDSGDQRAPRLRDIGNAGPHFRKLFDILTGNGQLALHCAVDATQRRGEFASAIEVESGFKSGQN